jgi:C_GCAxxG_C_C family probable redox protein
MSKYLDEARRMRAITTPHYNCAQGVIAAFAKDAGYDPDKSYAIASNFGHGMKRGATCGAVSGSLMVLGMYGVTSNAAVARFYQRFAERHEGMLLCQDLLKASRERGQVQKEHCDGLVFECVGLIEEILREEGKLD